MLDSASMCVFTRKLFEFKPGASLPALLLRR
jgi:hypothetical protein